MALRSHPLLRFARCPAAAAQNRHPAAQWLSGSLVNPSQTVEPPRWAGRPRLVIGNWPTPPRRFAVGLKALTIPLAVPFRSIAVQAPIHASLVLPLARLFCAR